MRMAARRLRRGADALLLRRLRLPVHAGRADPPSVTVMSGIDQKPPRLQGDERATLMALLQYQRASLVRKVAGLDDDAARGSVVASGTSLLWLVKHLAAAEVTWILRRFAGQDVAVPDATVHADDRLADAIDAYREVWRKADAILGAAVSLDE